MVDGIMELYDILSIVLSLSNKKKVYLYNFVDLIDEECIVLGE